MTADCHFPKQSRAATTSSAAAGSTTSSSSARTAPWATAAARSSRPPCPQVTFLARTKDKAEQGLKAAVNAVRSRARWPIGSTPATTTRTSTRPSRKADLIFEAVTEDFDIKRRMFERVDKVRRPGLDRRHGDERSVDQRARRGPERVVPEALPRPALLQSAERHRRHRAHRRARTPIPKLVDFVDAYSHEDARPRDDPHRGHARLRRQPRRLQGAERGGAARRGARPRARRAARRPVHRARADAARDRSISSAGTSTAPSSTTSTRTRPTRRTRRSGCPGYMAALLEQGHARQQERRRLLQGREQGEARARSEERAPTGPRPR